MITLDADFDLPNYAIVRHTSSNKYYAVPKKQYHDYLASIEALRRKGVTVYDDTEAFKLTQKNDTLFLTNDMEMINYDSIEPVIINHSS